MKKFEHLILLSITLIFIGLMIGLIIGRSGNNSPLLVNKYQNTLSSDAIAETNQSKDPITNKININFASAKELALLPGICDTYAQRIIDYREKHGPYLTIYDLEKVNGFGKKRVESIAQYITVGG